MALNMGQIYQCCFCGFPIEPIPPDVGGLLFTTMVDQDDSQRPEQQLFCHVRCLQKRLDKSAKLYLLDVDSVEP
jgi:hypothetical protein